MVGWYHRLNGHEFEQALGVVELEILLFESESVRLSLLLAFGLKSLFFLPTTWLLIYWPVLKELGLGNKGVGGRLQVFQIWGAGVSKGCAPGGGRQDFPRGGGGGGGECIPAGYFSGLLGEKSLEGKAFKKKVAQSCPTLCDPVDCSLPGPSVHGILQERILEWVAISFSRGSSRPRDRTQGSNPGLPHCGQTLYPLSHQEALDKR